MNEVWNQPGRIDVTREQQILRLRIGGNFHRDLDPEPRDTLCRELEVGSDADRLLLDLRDLLRLDSWGEEQLADRIDDLVQRGGNAAILGDAARPHHLRSLQVLLRRHADRVRFGTDEAALRVWLGEAIEP